MSNYKTCMACGAELFADDIAIYRKLINRAATSFWCIGCLAAHFKCPRRAIQELIQYYRDSGECTLFR